MARNEKLPFSYIETISATGYLREIDPELYVPDILSLAIDIQGGKLAGIIISGKIGASGDWTTILSSASTSKENRLDISEYSYIKVNVITSKSVVVSLFGYHAEPLAGISELSTTKLEEHTMLMNNTLNNILKEIKALNEKIDIITGEEC